MKAIKYYANCARQTGGQVSETWFLAFMFVGQPMVSGPFTLQTCLEMAQVQMEKSGYKAHCYKPYERRYPEFEGRTRDSPSKDLDSATPAPSDHKEDK